MFGKVEFFCCGCFDIDVVQIGFQIFGNCCVYCLNIRGYFWCLGNDSDVCIIKYIILCFDMVIYIFEEFVVVCFFLFIIGIWEVVVNVFGSNCVE